MRKKYKILLYIILFLIAVSTSSYATSVSKYIIDKEVDIRYGITYQKMTSTSLSPNATGFGIDHTQSTSETIVYKFQYYRSTNMQTTDTSDTYKLVTPSGCSLKSTYSNVSGTYNNGTKKISFTKMPNINDNKSTDLIKYVVSCPVSSVTEGNLIKLDFVIYETFNDEEKEYQYTDLHYSIALSKYYEKHPLTADYFDNTTNTIYLEKEYTGATQDATIYSRFSEQLKSYTTDLASINYYILGYNINSTSTLNDINKVDGLNVDETTNDKYYLIKIDNYFMSYANTYQNQNLNRYFFPQDLNNEEINNLFYYYLQKYRYQNYNIEESNDKKEYDAIKTYLDNATNNSNIIEVSKNKKIAAIKYNAENNYLQVSENLYECAIIGEITLLNANINKEYQTASTIRRTIAQALMEKGITQSIARLIVASEKIYNAYINISNHEIIEDYIYISDGVDSIIIHTLPTTEDELEIRIEVFILKSGNNIKLTYDESDTTSPFEDMNEILTKYYGESGTIALENGTSNDESNLNNLVNGEYNTNIGYIIISSNSSNKVIQIHLK